MVHYEHMIEKIDPEAEIMANYFNYARTRSVCMPIAIGIANQTVHLETDKTTILTLLC